MAKARRMRGSEAGGLVAPVLSRLVSAQILRPLLHLALRRHALGVGKVLRVSPKARPPNSWEEGETDTQSKCATRSRRKKSKLGQYRKINYLYKEEGGRPQKLAKKQIKAIKKGGD